MARVIKKKPKRPWQDVAKEAQDYRDASVARVKPDVPQLPKNLPNNVINILGEALTPEERQITETSTEDLLNILSCGKLTATTVTSAFLRRAGLAQKLVCLERCGILFSMLTLCIDQLHYRAPPRESSSQGPVSRWLLCST
jgi:hypothetical protein